MKKLFIFVLMFGVLFAADGFNTTNMYMSRDPELADMYNNPAAFNYGFLLEFEGAYASSSSLTYSDPFTLSHWDGNVTYVMIDTVNFTGDSSTTLVDTTFTPKLAYSFQIHETDDDNSFDNNPTMKIYGAFKPNSNEASEVATLGTATDTTNNEGEVQIFVPIHYPYYFVTINAGGTVDSDGSASFEVQLYPYWVE